MKRRTDKERIDWLTDQKESVFNICIGMDKQRMRDAIDAAMDHEKK